MRSEEGNIFFLGCVMLIVWICAIAILWQFGHELWHQMLTLGFAHLIAGRALSVAQATNAGIAPWIIAVLATYTDMMAMFIAYPLMVFSYKHLIEGRFFQRHAKPVFDAARKGLHRMGHFKILAVFLFVWFPFWMTGIIAGSIMGFLLGLPTWVTLLTASLGSAAAITSWVYAYNQVFARLSTLHRSIPVAATAIILGILVVYRIKTQRTLRRNNHSDDSAP